MGWMSNYVIAWYYRIDDDDADVGLVYLTISGFIVTYTVDGRTVSNAGLGSGSPSRAWAEHLSSSPSRFPTTGNVTRMFAHLNWYVRLDGFRYAEAVIVSAVFGSWYKLFDFIYQVTYQTVKFHSTHLISPELRRGGGAQSLQGAANKWNLFCWKCFKTVFFPFRNSNDFLSQPVIQSQSCFSMIA